MAIDHTAGHELIKQFLATLSLRQLTQCADQLAALQLLAATQPAYVPWCDYLAGILANERDHDWAQAERIFSRLLRLEALEPALQGRVLVALGLTYEYQGRWSDAIHTYERSLSVFAELNQTLDQVKVYKNIAIAYRKGFTGDHFGPDSLQQAVLCCQRALDLLHPFTDAVAEDVLWLKGSVLNTLGANHLILEQWDEAIACYEQDLAICRALDDRFGMGISYNNLGEVYERRGPAAWGQAEAAYQQALTLIRTFGNVYQEADTVANLGSLYRAMGEHARSLELYGQAIDLIEGLRARVSSEEARTGFFTTVVDTYASAVQVCVEAGHPARAFDTMERARARAFVELLAQQAVRHSPRLSPALLQQEQAVRAELGQLYAAPQEHRQPIKLLEEQLAALHRQIRLLDAEYADLRTVHPLTQAEVQARLPEGTALLAYFTAGNQLLACVVTPDALTIHPLPLSLPALRRVFGHDSHVQRLLPGAGGKLHRPWLLERLYQALFAPVVPRLQGQHTLCILPHAALHYVPFHALAYTGADGRLRAVLDDYAVIYAPSATVLLEYCQRKRSSTAASGLVLGYNGADLHYAEAEARAIAQLLGATPLVGGGATRTAVLQETPSKRWVHFSCHGRFNAHAPLTSHLLLADGPLYAADILQELQLQAELVTLSACETGRNQVLKGDELIGLARAFIYAGTPSVLVSLWPVDELSTRILMERFYQGLLAGQSKAAAVRTAQRTLRDLTAPEVEAILTGYGAVNPAGQVERLRSLTGDDRVFAHPYFWSPFMLVGDQLDPPLEI